jgi:peptide-methionine (S)-S-oxide reductase
MAIMKATFAAGCFWGVEAKFIKVRGVIDTVVGYTGGDVDNPTYKMVCSHKTGHAEAVQVTYDPDQVSYEALVRVFFELHNPTTLNRQGFDIGNQYRSAIFYHNKEQEQIARKIVADLEGASKFRRSIVTEISPLKEFFRAEEYHQRYYQKHHR